MGLDGERCKWLSSWLARPCCWDAVRTEIASTRPSLMWLVADCGISVGTKRHFAACRFGIRSGIDALSQVLNDISFYRCGVLGPGLKVRGPPSTWVKHVPAGLLTLVAPLAWVVVSETVDQCVPERLKSVY